LGPGYSDGWGAHCYAASTKGGNAKTHDAKTGGNDRSFRSWTCAEGLTCEIAGKTSRMGMCFIKASGK
jgi:hypothetical protein